MTYMATIRILLVDDHAIVREGYLSLLAKQPGLQVVAEAADGDQAYQRFKECSPDVVITDLSLPGISGLELISRIKQRDASAKILVFSMHQNPGFAVQASRAGALGYVTKSSPPEVLLRAIHEVYSRSPHPEHRHRSGAGAGKARQRTYGIGDVDGAGIRDSAPVGRSSNNGRNRANPQHQPENRQQLPLFDQAQTRRCQRHRADAIGDQAECD